MAEDRLASPVVGHPAPWGSVRWRRGAGRGEVRRAPLAGGEPVPEARPVPLGRIPPEVVSVGQKGAAEGAGSYRSDGPAAVPVARAAGTGRAPEGASLWPRSEEHTSELQS